MPGMAMDADASASTTCLASTTLPSAMSRFVELLDDMDTPCEQDLDLFGAFASNAPAVDEYYRTHNLRPPTRAESSLPIASTSRLSSSVDERSFLAFPRPPPLPRSASHDPSTQSPPQNVIHQTSRRPSADSGRSHSPAFDYVRGGRLSFDVPDRKSPLGCDAGPIIVIQEPRHARKLRKQRPSLTTRDVPSYAYHLSAEPDAISPISASSSHTSLPVQPKRKSWRRSVGTPPASPSLDSYSRSPLSQSYPFHRADRVASPTPESQGGRSKAVQRSPVSSDDSYNADVDVSRKWHSAITGKLGQIGKGRRRRTSSGSDWEVVSENAGSGGSISNFGVARPSFERSQSDQSLQPNRVSEDELRGLTASLSAPDLGKIEEQEGELSLSQMALLHAPGSPTEPITPLTPRSSSLRKVAVSGSTNTTPKANTASLPPSLLTATRPPSPTSVAPSLISRKSFLTSRREVDSLSSDDEAGSDDEAHPPKRRPHSTPPPARDLIHSLTSSDLPAPITTPSITMLYASSALRPLKMRRSQSLTDLSSTEDWSNGVTTDEGDETPASSAELGDEEEDDYRTAFSSSSNPVLFGKGVLVGSPVTPTAEPMERQLVVV